MSSDNTFIIEKVNGVPNTPIMSNETVIIKNVQPENVQPEETEIQGNDGNTSSIEEPIMNGGKKRKTNNKKTGEKKRKNIRWFKLQKNDRRSCK